MTEEKKKPDQKVKDGSINVDAWKHEAQTEFGKKVYWKTKITQSYIDSDGNWGNTEYIDAEKIPKLIMSLQRLYQKIQES